MRTKEFVDQLEHDRIVGAIRDAESKTSAEIRVFIERGDLAAEPLLVAQKKFQKLGMHRTAERNGVLIFVAPRARKFAVVGDEGIHARCGEGYWQSVVDLMTGHFRNARFSDAIAEAIQDVGEVLGRHFPKSPDDTNELPDEIVEG
ncbi:MAG: TPM domain-containing protein [Spartobacteria bacterium]